MKEFKEIKGIYVNNFSLSMKLSKKKKKRDNNNCTFDLILVPLLANKVDTKKSLIRSGSEESTFPVHFNYKKLEHPFILS